MLQNSLAQSETGGTFSPLCECTEADLVGLARSGDELAFEELVNRNYTKCYRLALALLRRHDHAEDAVSEALSKAYQHLSDFEYRSTFSHWLRAIVVNACRAIGRSGQLAFVEFDETAFARSYRPMFETGNPEQIFARQEIDRLVRQEISRMPPLFRIPLYLRLQDKSVEQIASHLGVGVGAAKSRLLRARIELRSRLAPAVERRHSVHGRGEAETFEIKRLKGPEAVGRDAALAE